MRKSASASSGKSRCERIMGSWKELISLLRFEAEILTAMRGVETLYGGSFRILERARLDTLAISPIFFDDAKIGGVGEVAKENEIRGVVDSVDTVVLRAEGAGMMWREMPLHVETRLDTKRTMLDE